MAGMGHIARSASLIDVLEAQGHSCQVVLRTDAEGHTFAKHRGLTVKEIELTDFLEPEASVVLDAIAIPHMDAALLSRMRRRILISPVCNRADIATAVLVRFAPKKLLNQTSDCCTIIQDERFANVTTADLVAKSLSYEDLTIGVCLSAGSAQKDIDELVKAAAIAPRVNEVRVIHPEAPRVEQAQKTILHRAFCHDPWSFLSSVNVFVGGDGVMIAEAVAQGLPCLSVNRPESPNKNQFLADVGCIRVCTYDEAPGAVAAMVSDRSGLAAMHQAARSSNSSQNVNALADAITGLLEIEKVKG